MLSSTITAYLSWTCLLFAVGQCGGHVLIGLTGQRLNLSRLRHLSGWLVMSGLALSFTALIAALTQGDLAAMGLRVDTLSAVVLALVALVGATVLRFSFNYLDGDKRQAHFLSNLHLTLATVVVFVMAANIWLLAASWIAMSLTLHRLLLFYPDRAGARRAAFKKFVMARLGDVCLVGALACLQRATGTSDIASILSTLHGLPQMPQSVYLAGYLLVMAAVCKSAQFPLHGWLIEVMETPTPVSALLHAGVVNAGGIMLIRFADIVALNAPALWLLAAFATLSIIIGTLASVTQTTVKAALAWSTVAQMGFMLLQCALGAFGGALFHIVAHALYKANAFLRCGTLREPGTKGLNLSILWIPVSVAILCVLAAYCRMEANVLVTLVAGIGLCAGLPNRRPEQALTLGALVLAASLCGHWLGDVAIARAAGPVSLGMTAFAIAGMALLVGLQALVCSTFGHRSTHALYVHVRNGFYINALLNRRFAS